jgi:hypothetical protein
MLSLPEIDGRADRTKEPYDGPDRRSSPRLSADRQGDLERRSSSDRPGDLERWPRPDRGHAEQSAVLPDGRDKGILEVAVETAGRRPRASAAGRRCSIPAGESRAGGNEVIPPAHPRPADTMIIRAPQPGRARVRLISAAEFVAFPRHLKETKWHCERTRSAARDW